MTSIINYLLFCRRGTNWVAVFADTYSTFAWEIGLFCYHFLLLSTITGVICEFSINYFFTHLGSCLTFLPFHWDHYHWDQVLQRLSLHVWYYWVHHVLELDWQIIMVNNVAEVIVYTVISSCGKQTIENQSLSRELIALFRLLCVLTESSTLCHETNSLI